MKAAEKFGHRYPWDDWFSNLPITLTKGREFDCMVHGMAQMIRNVASDRRREGSKLKVRVFVLDDERVRVEPSNGNGRGRRA